jgi:hypothetical protein
LKFRCLSADPKVVRVELYADGVDDGSSIRQEMMLVRHQAGAIGDYVYRATVSAIRAATDYTARGIPYGSGLVVPLEPLIFCGSGDSIPNMPVNPVSAHRPITYETLVKGVNQ